MGLQTSFGVLSQIVEQYESNGWSVQHVESRSGKSEGVLTVTMDLSVSLCSSGGLHAALNLESATLTAGGGLRMECSPPVLTNPPLTTETAVSASSQSVRVTGDNSLLLTVEFTIDPDDERESSERSPDAAQSRSDPADPFTEARDESVPPYEDTDYLQRLYDSCETFTEMRRKIQMDVSTETVRRYMIDAGIHDPVSYNSVTENESSDEHRVVTIDNRTGSIPDEQLLTDGVGLPEGCHIEAVIDAVVDSATVYDVQRSLGLERQPTQQLLQQLNLLDLVTHRIDDNPNGERSYEDVTKRIRQGVPTSP